MTGLAVSLYRGLKLIKPNSLYADISLRKSNSQYTSQSLKLKKTLKRQYLAALRHQYTLYVVQVVADLAII